MLAESSDIENNNIQTKHKKPIQYAAAAKREGE